MKKIILIATALVFVGCSDNGSKEVDTKSASASKQATKVQEQKHVVKEVKSEPTVIKSSKSGSEIYLACSACHGVNGEKVALGKSKIIKGWDSSKTESALNGYKDGSYGGSMKGLMKGQLSSLNAQEIKAVSEHISKL